MLSDHDSIKKNTLHCLEKTNLTQNLAAFIKYIESKNPDHKDKTYKIMWQEQCYINFPILYLASISLYLYAKKNGCNTFLFATRDGCHWHKIFKKMFPNEKVHYFHTSRKMFESAVKSHNKYYKEYVKSLVGHNIEKTVYIDIHGKGARCFSYFQKEFNVVPYIYMLSGSIHSYSDYPLITQKNYYKGKFTNVVFDTNGSPIEMLNYDLVGSLIGYDKNGQIREKIEYDKKLIQHYHKCIELIISKIKPLDGDLLIEKYNQTNLYHLVNKLYNVIKTTKPFVSKYIKHK